MEVMGGKGANNNLIAVPFGRLTVFNTATYVQQCTRGVACSNSRPQPGVKTFGGLEGGGGGRWVGRSAAGVPRGGVSGYPNIRTSK